MSETQNVRLRIAIIALAIANVLFFGYAVLSPDSSDQAGASIEELQINPGRIKLVGSATRGPGGQPGTRVDKGGYRACLDWGPFAAADIGRAESALGRLGLPQAPLQRPVSGTSGAKRFSYFVREPDAATVAQIAELQRAFPGSEIKAGPCPS